MTEARERGELLLRPIGFARTPHAEKADAPRQPAAALGIEGTLEILAEYRDGLRDLAGFDRLIVVFGFDRAPKTRSLTVQPPRSATKRGVFATRSPHRPNPIGISIVRLVAVDDLRVRIADVDLLDGTPIYDLKPYLAYTDAFPDARAGWLDADDGSGPVASLGPHDPSGDETATSHGLTPHDPRRAYEVVVAEAARDALAFVETEDRFPLEKRAVESLALGPEPHAYRRIRVVGDVSVLAVKAWRIVFVYDARERRITIVRVRSGHSPRDLARDDRSLDVHRRFVERFGS